MKKINCLIYLLLLLLNPNLKFIRFSTEFKSELATNDKSMTSIAGIDDDCDYKNTLKNQMYDYFKNLNKYSPNNEFGTCGYVALIQILSYYDNFYDDRIIDNKFNRYEKNQSEYSIDSELISPGVYRGSYKNSYGNVKNTVLNVCGFDYQYYLINEYKKYLNQKNPNEEIDFKTSLNVELTKEVVENCLNIKPKKITKYYDEELDQEQYLRIAKDSISNGLPVILNVRPTKNSDGSFVGHAIVAYDIDSKNNIYANFGWSENFNHKYIFSDNYVAIYGLEILEFNANDDSKTNYIINSRQINYFEYYSRIVMNPTLYSKSSGRPTFIWKHSSDSSEYFDVEIGIINNDGTLSTMINGTTSYNRFVLSEQATLYLYEYAQSGKGIFASLKRYEGYGFINYNTVISYFYIS